MESTRPTTAGEARGTAGRAGAADGAAGWQLGGGQRVADPAGRADPGQGGGNSVQGEWGTVCLTFTVIYMVQDVAEILSSRVAGAGLGHVSLVGAGLEEMVARELEGGAEQERA